MRILVFVLAAMFLSVSWQPPVAANEFKEREARIAKLKVWLDEFGPSGEKFWLRLNAKKRPHHLYLGEAFFNADAETQENFIDRYSNYLAGHMEKFMLIDLFDAKTGELVGEYGFGGFKLLPQFTRVTQAQ